MELLTNFSIEAAVQIALQELENDPSTQLRGTSTRSDRGPIEPGDLNTFTIAAVTLKEHNLIDEKHKKIGKRGKFSAISLGSSRVNTSRG